jgi:hypothetical protein
MVLPVKVSLKTPVGCPSLDEDEEEREGGSVPSECPVLDIRNGVSRRIIAEHIRNFICRYYQIADEEISEDLSLIDDIEKKWHARLTGVSVEDVEYSRLGIDRDGSGGISDRGLTVYMLLFDLSDSMGLEVSLNDGGGLNEAIFTAQEGDIFHAISAAQSLRELTEAFGGLLEQEGLLIDP